MFNLSHAAARPVRARVHYAPLVREGATERSQDCFRVAESRLTMRPCGATGVMEARPTATRWVRVLHHCAVQGAACGASTFLSR